MLEELVNRVDELIESNKSNIDYQRIGLVKPVKNHYTKGPLINLLYLFGINDCVYVFKFKDNSESSQMRSALNNHKIKFVNSSNYIFSEPFNDNLKLGNFNITAFGLIKKPDLEGRIKQGIKDKSSSFIHIIDESTTWFRFRVS